MKGWKSFIITILFLLIIPLSFAATIHGTVYDLGLNKVQNAIVEIDTTPKQLMVAKNASYSFSVPKGNYTIGASHKSLGTANETLSVAEEGTYVLDLILFPAIDDELANETFIGFDEAANATNGEKVWPWIAGIGAILAVIAWFFWKKQKKGKTVEAVKEEPIGADDLQQVVAFIKKEGGRATQKDIRKASPLSEAKISLILTELEHQHKIEKIKKGRGNVIVLK